MTLYQIITPPGVACSASGGIVCYIFNQQSHPPPTSDLQLKPTPPTPNRSAHSWNSNNPMELAGGSRVKALTIWTCLALKLISWQKGHGSAFHQQEGQGSALQDNIQTCLAHHKIPETLPYHKQTSRESKIRKAVFSFRPNSRYSK